MGQVWRNAGVAELETVGRLIACDLPERQADVNYRIVN